MRLFGKDMFIMLEKSSFASLKPTIMDVFKFIFSKRGELFTQQQQKFIKHITVYTKNGKVVDFGVTAKPERMKKARQVGLCVERKITHIDDGPQLADPFGHKIQHGSFMLMYRPDTRALDIFKLH